jgi:hypothetical protein
MATSNIFHSDEASFAELPRSAPLPTAKPCLHPSFPPPKGSIYELKSLKRERMLNKQRLLSAESRPFRPTEVSNWHLERTKPHLNRAYKQADSEEEPTEKWANIRKHTISEVLCLPAYLLLLCQESELPRECPAPIQPSKQAAGEVDLPSSSGKLGSERKDISSVKGSKGPRAGLRRCRQPFGAVYRRASSGKQVNV